MNDLNIIIKFIPFLLKIAKLENLKFKFYNLQSQ